MLENIFNFIKNFDRDLTLILEKYYEPYIPFKEPPFFAGYLTHFTKVIFYSLFVLLPFLFLKILYPYAEKINLVIYIILIVSGLALFGVFIGLFQILFTF